MKRGSHSTSLRADPLVSCPAAGSYSGCHRGAVRVSPSSWANGRRARSLRRHQSTAPAPAHAQDAGHTFALALSSVSRREGKWSHGIFPPFLPLLHTCTHTPAPVPPFSPAKPKALSSAPLPTLPTHPGQTSRNAAGAFCQIPRKISFRLVCGPIAGLPTWGTGKGLGGLQVWVCQLMWAASICRHTPQGRGPQAWCPHEPLQSPGVGRLGAPGINGREEGPAFQAPVGRAELAVPGCYVTFG